MLRLHSLSLLATEGVVGCVAFRPPDGNTVAVGFGSPVTGNGGLILIDSARGQRLYSTPLVVNQGTVLCTAFSPDGKTVAAGYERVSGSGGGVVLWDIDLESWKRIAGRLTNRNLSRSEWRRYFSETPYRRTIDDLPVPIDETSTDWIRAFTE
jgi:WD40 repeat protein